MGCPNQNFIAFDSKQRDDYVQRHIKVGDIYISVYAFSELDESNHVKRESAIIDKIFFDFDSDQWFADMMKVHYWAESYDLLHRCHYSANKGAHIYMFTNENITNKVEAVGNFQRWLQNQLDLQMDTKIIGDIARICRYPNSYNFKARRFCIPIPFSVLNPSLTENWLYKHATQQIFANAWCGHKLLNLQRWDVQEFQYMDFDAEEVELNAITPVIAENYKEFPPCVQQWLSTPNLRDDQKFMLILYLKDQLITTIPYDPKEIAGILKQTLSVDEFAHYFSTKPMRHHTGHNGVKFHTLMKKNYYLPNCSKLQQKGLCTNDCGRRHPIYD
jgi:hypothetical protein